MSLNTATYDFKSKLEEIAPAMKYMHELAEARFNIDLISGTYAELQANETSARLEAASWKTKAFEAMLLAKSYKVMMDVVKNEPVLQEQFDSLLTMLKLFCPDIEDRMKLTPSDLGL